MFTGSKHGGLCTWNRDYHGTVFEFVVGGGVLLGVWLVLIR